MHVEALDKINTSLDKINERKKKNEKKIKHL